MNLRINEYVYLVELSLKYLRESICSFEQETNRSDLKTSEFHEAYYKINYHAFCFSQLIYALYLRLEKHPESDKNKLENIFKKNTSVSKVYLIANKVKHTEQKDNINISLLTKLQFKLSKDSRTMELIDKKIDRTISSVDSQDILPKLKNVEIYNLYESAYKELISFLEKENFPIQTQIRDTAIMIKWVSTNTLSQYKNQE